jgi:hypothetical protein
LTRARCLTCAGRCWQKRSRPGWPATGRAANAVCYGGGAGRLRMMVISGVLHCQVSDAGTGGRGPGTVGPWPVQPGHGLWLVAGIADQVNFAPGLAGSEVTVTFALSGTDSEQAGYLSAGSDRARSGGDGR